MYLDFPIILMTEFIFREIGLLVWIAVSKEVIRKLVIFSGFWLLNALAIFAYVACMQNPCDQLGLIENAELRSWQ